jgi:hypothetical protein
MEELQRRRNQNAGRFTSNEDDTTFAILLLVTKSAQVAALIQPRIRRGCVTLLNRERSFRIRGIRFWNACCAGRPLLPAYKCESCIKRLCSSYQVPLGYQAFECDK